MFMLQEFLTAQQVAHEYLNDVCSYHKVLRLTRNGKIPATRLGKSYLYKRAILDEWAANQFSWPVEKLEVNRKG